MLTLLPFDHPPPIQSSSSCLIIPHPFDHPPPICSPPPVCSTPSRPIGVSHPIDPFLIFDLDSPTQIPKDLQFKFEPKLTTIYSSLSNLNCYYPLKWTIDKGSYDQDIRDTQATSIGIWGKIYYCELKIIEGGSRKFWPETEKNVFFQLRWPLSEFCNCNFAKVAGVTNWIDETDNI